MTDGQQGGQVELLTDDEDLSDVMLNALAHTFIRFSSRASEGAKKQAKVEVFDAKSISWLNRLTLTDDELDTFAKTVNSGKPMSASEKDEIREYFDVDDEQRLTVSVDATDARSSRESLTMFPFADQFRGFCEMYNLQTTSQPDETWKDLRALGFDDQLKQRAENEERGQADDTSKTAVERRESPEGK